MNNINDEDATTITMQKVKENHYESELFDTKYELEFKDDTIEVKELENNKEQKLTGEYKRVESLTKEEVINLFMQ